MGYHSLQFLSFRSSFRINQAGGYGGSGDRSKFAWHSGAINEKKIKTWSVPILINFNESEMGAVLTTIRKKKIKVRSALTLINSKF